MSTFGLLEGYDSSIKISRVFELERGNLNSLRIYPKGLNEHQERNSEVQDVVESGVIVAQIAQLSADNIDTLSFTGESAAARTELDNIESGTYANDPALQAVWIKAGTQEAVLESTIIQNPSEHGQSSDRSMKLDTSNNDGEWEATTLNLAPNAATIDLTGATIELDHYQTHAPAQQQIMIYIEDGSANRSTFNLLADTTASFKHFNIEVAAFTGTCDVSDVEKIGFDMVTLRPSSFVYIDNMNYLIVTGTINMKLFHLGSTLPVGDGASFDLTNDATQYTELGALGDKSEIVVSLLGGRHIYHVDDFIAGRNGTSVLIPGDYYAVTFNYVDEDVSLYGYSASDQYINGYVFNTSAENADISQIGGVGSNNDLMFYMFSAVSAWIGPTDQADAYHLHFINAAGDLISPGENSSWVTHVEDENGQVQIVTVHGGHPVSGGDYVEKFRRPIFIPLGGLFEVEYSHDPEGEDVAVELELFFVWKRTEANL